MCGEASRWCGSAIICEVMAELTRAKRKFPGWPADDLVECAAIVGEEAGELIRAALHHKNEGGTVEDCDKEAIQTIAMCVRFLQGA